jgi:hypothetical protein
VSGSSTPRGAAQNVRNGIANGLLFAHASFEKASMHHQHIPKIIALASVAALLALGWSTDVSADETRDGDDHDYDNDDDNDDDDEEEAERFDSGVNLYIAPGGLNQPLAGRDRVDYLDNFDPGYQWGLGIGYFFRSDSPFALHVGPFFEHAIINADGRDLGDDGGEHLFRAGLELEPGVVLGERLFLGVPLRGGYAGNLLSVGDDTDMSHGGHFGAGLGIDLALWSGFYIGTSVGADLHFFRIGADNYDAYALAWRTRVGYRF